MHNVEAIKQAIDILGSASRLAIETKVTHISVSKWKNGKASPSLENCLRIECVTDGRVKAIDVRPDLVELVKILKDMRIKE